MFVGFILKYKFLFLEIINDITPLISVSVCLLPMENYNCFCIFILYPVIFVNLPIISMRVLKIILESFVSMQSYFLKIKIVLFLPC